MKAEKMTIAECNSVSAAPIHFNAICAGISSLMDELLKSEEKLENSAETTKFNQKTREIGHLTIIEKF